MEELVVAGEADASTSESRDPERFYCPHLGCNRSFAELWRLKVHYRAPPDVRGSGKERGHGTELEFCPKCNKDLKPGKHHVGCSASKRQSKRARQESSELGSQEVSGARASLGSESLQPKTSPKLAAEENTNAWAGTSLVAAVQHPHQPHQHPMPQHCQQHYPHYPLPAPYSYPGPNGMTMSMWPMPGLPGHPPFAVMLPPGSIHPYAMPMMAMHPSLAPFHPDLQASAAPAMACAPPPPQQPAADEQRNSQLAKMFDDEEVVMAHPRAGVPSPPPLPPDFAAQHGNGSSSGNGMLFNFQQFAQRMPTAQPMLSGANKLVKDLSQEAMDLAEANVVYETHDDGDLMELLFGVADEMPTMATFHLHTFASQSGEAPQQPEPRPDPVHEPQPSYRSSCAEQPQPQEQQQQHQHQQHQHQQHQHQQQQHQHQQQQQQQPYYSNGSVEPQSMSHVKHEMPLSMMPMGVVGLKQDHTAQQLDECFQLSGEHYEPCAQLARAAQPGIGLV